MPKKLFAWPALFRFPEPLIYFLSIETIVTADAKERELAYADQSIGSGSVNPNIVAELLNRHHRRDVLLILGISSNHRV
jgi:hypothetical protein